MAKPTKLFRRCSLLMSFMFAYSASVQFNDPDRYLWFPLYACASAVNLMNWKTSSKIKIVKKVAKLTLLLGVFLFMKVVIEDLVKEISGFWSLDLRERVVREKIGSGLVVISMILQGRGKNRKIAELVDLGMAALVGFSYGIPLVFFLVQKGEMKF